VIQSSDHPELGDRALVLVEVAEEPRRAQLFDLAHHLAERRKLVERDARLQHRGECVQLALGRRPPLPAGSGVAIPGVRKAAEARTPAVAVRREHRADATVPIGVRAHDDAVRPGAGEHGLARFDREAVDGGA